MYAAVGRMLLARLMPKVQPAYKYDRVGFTRRLNSTGDNIVQYRCDYMTRPFPCTTSKFKQNQSVDLVSHQLKSHRVGPLFGQSFGRRPRISSENTELTALKINSAEIGRQWSESNRAVRSYFELVIQGHRMLGFLSHNKKQRVLFLLFSTLDHPVTNVFRAVGGGC
ncbi:hypothetical protein J6590_034255 [Homalodisca vitripennis]|nr:hypothetical protein J6590_034255 [Homalodisca vitripennis]